MNVFRIFFASILIPLISVGLCATGESSLGKHRVHRTVFISEEGNSRKLENGNPNSTIHFPSLSGEAGTASSQEPRGTISLASGTKDSLPYHPHPLKLDIKSIKNSTRIDDSLLILDHGEARHGHGIYDHYWKYEAIAWLFNILWKVVTSYVFVGIINLIFGKFWHKFGWGGPTWEFKSTLGTNGKKDHDDGGHGGHGHGHGGVGHGGQGWQSSYGHHKDLSYDQYLAMPYVNKYSQKAAKKAAKYTKKAQKFAAKASKAAAKAHVYRLQVAPYTTGYLHPGQIHQGHDCVNCKFSS